MQNQNSNRALIQVQINSLERTKERLWFRAIYAIFYSAIMSALLVIFLAMGNPFGLLFALLIIFGIILFIYHYSRIKSIDHDIWYLESTIRSDYR
jgi:hypothetical protein